MESKVYKFKRGNLESMSYLLSVPEKKDGEKLPMIVFLHGAGERGDVGVDDPFALCIHGIPKLLKTREIPAIVLAPQCPKDHIWNHLVCELKELIDAIAEEYDADPDRISLTGMSMGGFGTWEMGMTYPGFFSALAPVCGGGVSWRVGEIGKTPVWAFHGMSDNVVEPENSMILCDRLKSLGGKVELTLLRYVGHDSWNFAYERTSLVDWLLASHR